MMRKKPMLAYPVSDKPIDYNSDIFMQPKLDGVRCVIQRESDFPDQEYLASFSVKAYSRTGKEWKNINHILKELKMNEAELNVLAIKIVSRMVKLKSMEDWFDHVNKSEIAWNIAYSDLELTEEEEALGEAAKLMTLMNLFQDEEEYEKCAIIKGRMAQVNKILKKGKK